MKNDQPDSRDRTPPDHMRDVFLALKYAKGAIRIGCDPTQYLLDAVESLARHVAGDGGGAAMADPTMPGTLDEGTGSMVTASTTIDTAALRGLLNSGTPGRWIAGAAREDGTAPVYCPNRGPARVIVPVAETKPSDANLIAALRNAAPALLDEVERLRAEVRVLTGQREALWMLLDNIDTLDDSCRDDDRAFREYTRKHQQRRFVVYDPEAAPIQPETEEVRLIRDRNEKDVHVAASPEAIEEVLRKEREDVGFALTDAEAAEAERAVAAGRLAGYVPKPRPDGREHLPTPYELDRAESIAERLRQEKQEQGEKLAELADHNEWLAGENERLGEANERLRRAIQATDLERELRSRAQENCKIAERERAEAVRSMLVAVAEIADHARRRREAEMAAEAHAKENARLTAENQELRAAMSLAQDQEAARTRAAVRSATLVLADEVTALKKQLLESGRG